MLMSIVITTVKSQDDEPTCMPTKSPIADYQNLVCDYRDLIDQCIFESSGSINYYECIGQSIYEYSCPSAEFECVDGIGFPDFGSLCTKAYLFDESQDCC